MIQLTIGVSAYSHFKTILDQVFGNLQERICSKNIQLSPYFGVSIMYGCVNINVRMYLNVYSFLSLPEIAHNAYSLLGARLRYNYEFASHLQVILKISKELHVTPPSISHLAEPLNGYL